MRRAIAPIPADHPFIVRTEGVCGGRPRIRDSRISVSTVAEALRNGDTREDLFALYPHIEPAAIDDAISYYFDHRPEIDEEIADNSWEAVLADTGTVLGEDGVLRFLRKPR